MMDIVWAEDSGAHQFLIQSVLDESNPPLRVTFARDGEEALKLVARHQPSVLVLDLTMPGVGGIAALRQLNKDPKLARCKAIVFSSTANARDLEAVRNLGAMACVEKPLDFDAFKTAVRAIANLALDIRLAGARAASPTTLGGKHHVLFWESEVSLIESVKQFLQSGLARGEGTIALAAPAHLSRLQRDIPGTDTVWLSTEDVAKAIRVGNRYDIKKFEEAFQQAFFTASKGGTRAVSCFGELVAVLQTRGAGDAAAEIETVGQQAAHEHPQSLSILCAYPVTSFSTTDALERACLLHISHQLKGVPLPGRPNNSVVPGQ